MPGSRARRLLTRDGTRTGPERRGRCGRWRRSWRTRGTRGGRCGTGSGPISTWSTRATPGWGTARSRNTGGATHPDRVAAPSGRYVCGDKLPCRQPLRSAARAGDLLLSLHIYTPRPYAGLRAHAAPSLCELRAAIGRRHVARRSHNPPNLPVSARLTIMKARTGSAPAGGRSLKRSCWLGWSTWVVVAVTL